MRRISWKRHGLWITAVVCVAALAVLSVALFGVPKAKSSPPVTIVSIDWTIQQGKFADGTNWFEQQYINQSGPLYGFPYQIKAGGSFNDSLVLVNTGNMSEPICSASTTPPLFVVSTSPHFPLATDFGEENTITLTISVQATAGGSVTATGVIDALGCQLP